MESVCTHKQHIKCWRCTANGIYPNIELGKHTWNDNKSDMVSICWIVFVYVLFFFRLSRLFFIFIFLQCESLLNVRLNFVLNFYFARFLFVCLLFFHFIRSIALFVPSGQDRDCCFFSRANGCSVVIVCLCVYTMVLPILLLLFNRFGS